MVRNFVTSGLGAEVILVKDIGASDLLGKDSQLLCIILNVRWCGWFS